MRSKIITSLAVLAICAFFIAWSNDRAYKTLDMLDGIAVEVMRSVDADDIASAVDRLGEMSVAWEDRRSFMETVMPHEDLQRVIEHITEAQADLRANDADDFSRSIALLRETIDHLRNHERLSWANVL